MQVFMTTPNGRKLTLEVEGLDTVESLREKVAGQYPDADPDLQLISINGKRLDDGHKLEEYGVHKESEFKLGIRPPEQMIELDVGGTPFTTVLTTLLSKNGSRLFCMFEPMRQGGQPTFGRVGRQGADIVTADLCAPKGPLPRSPRGSFLIDRDGPSFRYVLNYLRDGQLLAMPSAAAELRQLATEAQYYGLTDLANMCACPLLVLAIACGPGVTAADLVKLSPEQRHTLYQQEGINIVSAMKIEAEAALRDKLAPLKLTQSATCALVASGQTVESVDQLDAPAATKLGLDEEDARKVGEGIVGVELRRGLLEHYTGVSQLSEAATRLLAAAKLTLTDVRRLDGPAARQLGLPAEDVQKVLWDGEAGATLRRELEQLGLSDAGLSLLVSQGATADSIGKLDEEAARQLGLVAEDAQKVASFLAYDDPELGIHLNYDPTTRPWETVYDELYSHDMRNSFDDIKARCDKFRFVLIGGRGAHDTAFILCAIAAPREVFRATTGNESHEVSGAHWYCCAGKSMGFAPNHSISLSPADTKDESDTRRLSWHINGSGGWRVGSKTGLNGSAEYRKVVMGLV